MIDIETIFLDDKFGNYKYITEEDFPKRITNFSKINLLIGENNSGKSQFMRKLFQEEFQYHLKHLQQATALKILDELNSEMKGKCGQLEIIDYGGILEKLDEFDYLYSEGSLNKNIVNFKELLKTLQSIKSKLRFQVVYQGKEDGKIYPENFYKDINSFLAFQGDRFYMELEKLITRNSEDLIKIYIPTLRGLRPLREKEEVTEIKDYYFMRTVEDYFDKKYSKFTTDSNHQIFTGLNMYEEVKSLLLGNQEEREKIKQYENFLSENFFNGNQVTLIPRKDTDVLVVKIGNEIERPIYALGDGLQEIIIMTFQAFNHKGSNCLFFIEEPEIHLHPGLLRNLIKALSSFEECQFFLTTHSNHLLDLSLELEVTDLSIYKFTKVIDDGEEKKQVEPNFEIENVANGTVSILDVLGVQNTSVYLANCTIWVEGITDRYYLRHYLNLYMNDLKNNKPGSYVELKEDVHYAFIEYGGNNITHWSFLEDNDDAQIDTNEYGVSNIICKSFLETIDTPSNTLFKNINVDAICRKIFLITDRDSEKKDERHQKLKAKLGQDNYYCLEAKEIENLLSAKTLNKVIEEYEKGPAKYKQEFSEEDYKDKHLGEFINNILEIRNRRGSYSEKSGTVTKKIDFCSKAITYIEDIDSMSKEALVIAEKVYDFIIKQNNLT